MRTKKIFHCRAEVDPETGAKLKETSAKLGMTVKALTEIAVFAFTEMDVPQKIAAIQSFLQPKSA